MKKYIFSLLAVLLIAGAAFAASIPQTADPVNGGEIWLQGVYSSAAVDVGDVVVWDMGSSTGDDKAWVATTTTANTGLVAGVVYPRSIAAGDRGTIAIKGPVSVDASKTIAAGALVCSSTVAGEAQTCVSDDNAGVGAFGYATGAQASGQVMVNIF